MRWNFVIATLILAITPIVGVASPARTVITLKQAEHYDLNRDVYIRTSGFVAKSDVQTLYNKVKSELSYPVSVTYYNKHYFILVGPIRSAAAVQDAAEEIASLSVAAQTASLTEATPALSSAKSVVKQNNQDDSLLLASSTTQTTMGNKQAGNWVISAGLARQWPYYKSHLYINNNSGAEPPSNRDLYSTKRINQPAASLAAGYRFVRDSQWIPSYSLMLSYQHIFSANLGGTVMQYSSPDFTNYTYDWEVSSDVIMAMLKLNLFEVRRFSPYLLAGLGGAANLTNNYNEGALPPSPGDGAFAPRTNPDFGANSILQLAYRVGAGVDFQINPQFIASLEYQFQDIGSIQSQHGTGSWSTRLLRLGPYRSNGVQFGVTYLIDA